MIRTYLQRLKVNEAVGFSIEPMGNAVFEGGSVQRSMIALAELHRFNKLAYRFIGVQEDQGEVRTVQGYKVCLSDTYKMMVAGSSESLAAVFGELDISKESNYIIKPIEEHMCIGHHGTSAWLAISSSWVRGPEHPFILIRDSISDPTGKLFKFLEPAIEYLKETETKGSKV